MKQDKSHQQLVILNVTVIVSNKQGSIYYCVVSHSSISIVVAYFRATIEFSVDMVDHMAVYKVDRKVDCMAADMVVHRVADMVVHKVDCMAEGKVDHTTDHTSLDKVDYKVDYKADHKAGHTALNMVDHRADHMVDHTVDHKAVEEDNSEIDIASILDHLLHDLVSYSNEDHDVTPVQRLIPNQSLVKAQHHEYIPDQTHPFSD